MSSSDNRLINNPAARLILSLLGCLTGAVILGVVITRGGTIVAGGLIVSPLVLLFAALCFKRPQIGLFACLLLGFFLFSHSLGALIVKATGGAFSIGLTLDGCLLIALLGVLLGDTKKGLYRLHNPLMYILSFWMLYNVFQLVNPLAVSREPWFFTVRGFALYWFQVTVIGLVCLTQRSDLKRFIKLWLICCVVQALWSFKQQYIGLTGEEVDWLENFGKSTHVLHGFLRSFSLCSDAGQFGAIMAHATLFALIRMLDEPVFRKKAGYALLAGVFFWGFAVAGSRGPLIVLGVGFAVYLILKRNVLVLLVGTVVGAGAFGVLKFTNIGQSNYQVQRIRSALDPEDQSLQLRLYNQRMFAQYMASRPFGIGLGLAGDSGKKYTSSIVTEQGIDSWYVKIWVETGVVGLVIHVISLLLIAILGFRKIWHLHDPNLRSIMSGLLCGYVGIMFANYGNQLFGQSPTCFVIYLSIIFFVNSDRFDQVAEPSKLSIGHQ